MKVYKRREPRKKGRGDDVGSDDVIEVSEELRAGREGRVR